MLTSDERKRFTRNARLQVIQPDLLAQYLGAYKGLPVVAYKNKAQLFTTQRDVVFPPDLRVEEAILAWQAAEVAEEITRNGIKEAISKKDVEQERILKRGGRIFVLAVMGMLLAERNGPASISRLRREGAGSNRTRDRLSNYGTLALTWYVDIVKDLMSEGADLNVLVRSEDTFAKIRQKVSLLWKTLGLSKAWANDALPRLGG